jgi:hypothetical protein
MISVNKNLKTEKSIEKERGGGVILMTIYLLAAGVNY